MRCDITSKIEIGALILGCILTRKSEVVLSGIGAVCSFIHVLCNRYIVCMKLPNQIKIMVNTFLIA